MTSMKNENEEDDEDFIIASEGRIPRRTVPSDDPSEGANATMGGSRRGGGQGGNGEGNGRIPGNETSPENELTARIIGLLNTGSKNRQNMAHAILDLVDDEKVFNAADKNGVVNRTVPWHNVDRQLKADLATLVRSGDLNTEAGRARLANLFYILRQVLRPAEFNDFVGALRDIPTKANHADARGFAGWVDNADQAKDQIQTLLSLSEEEAQNQGRLVLGMTAENYASIESALRSDPRLPLDQLIEEGRLGFIIGDDAMTALDFVNQAQSLPMFNGLENFALHVLIIEGVSLPPSFFDLNARERVQLKAVAYIYYINAALEAVEVDISHIPDWNTFRKRLMQA